ncbi:uncharacterized protein LOC129755570 [Uranotaenia lowii]|uniref:uncharacterized protein LOC129755570 n=1 Tax=Uranotaenia lowii TaxID=190385 RepID=UPI0024783ED8|nr:uncharacterized protein LOC129755570 [Uranotaenia lowii]
MSAEEFIYSVINADNVGQLDLNVIANTLASTDTLVRQIKSQQVENENLKEKISSLRSSALQIKQLYEAELGKNQGTVNREEDYIRQVKELETRLSTAENDRVNAELREKETVAELERMLAESREKYDGLAMDMIRNCAILNDNFLLPTDQQLKFRELKAYAQGLAANGKDIPEDVISCMRKNRLKKKRVPETSVRDQTTMTNSAVAVASVGVNAVVLPVLKNASTSTLDLVQPPSVKPESLKKTLCDKSTMYSSSTITRSTCTSAFIKKVDVGVNYPEVIPKSIEEILRECVVELPSLLSPILDDIPLLKTTVHTQTDLATPPQASSPVKAQMVSCGTNTTLRNIRRKIEYVQKAKNNPMVPCIKKEERISPASSIQNLQTALQPESEQTLYVVHPQLSHIWALLGETLFRLLGNNRLVDTQCYDAINQRLADINNMIDPGNHRSGTEMMSEVFAAASAVISSSVASSVSTTCSKNDTQLPVGEKSMQDYEEEPDVGEDLSDNVAVSSKEVSSATEMTESSEAVDVYDTRQISTDTTVANSTFEDCSTDAEDLVKDVGSETAVTSIVAEEPKPNVNPSNTKDTSVTLPAVDSIKPAENVAGSFELETSKPSPVTSTDSEESNEYAALMEPNSGTQDASVLSKTQLPALHAAVEEDEMMGDIEHELLLMEEGKSVENRETSPERALPSPITITSLEASNEKHYVEVIADIETSSSLSDDGDRMLIIETSPVRKISSSSSTAGASSCTTFGSNGTLISPIKVKETNELLKDQFKAPTSPAISKRKRRDNIETSSPKRGRVSPTTDMLLQDDWDEKFSTIKDYFSVPNGLNTFEESTINCSSEKSEIPWSTVSSIACSSMSSLHSDNFDKSDTKQFKVPVAPGSLPILRIETETLAGCEEKITDSPISPVEEKTIVETSFECSPSVLSDSPESPTPLESPLSPPMCVSEAQDAESFDSPMSPAPEDRGSMYRDTVPAKVIPLKHEISDRLTYAYKNTPICKTISNYSKKRRGEVVQNMAPKKDVQLMRKLGKTIDLYLSEDWTEDNLRKCAEALLLITDEPKPVVAAIIDSAVSKKDMTLDSQCSPPAPVLPKVVQKLVTLLKALNETLFTLDRIAMLEIDKRVFTLKSDKVDIDTVVSMTFLYVGIADSSRIYGCTARMYIYKCLYYFQFKGLPLIYVVLKAFPHALPKKGSQFYDNSDAMVNTIRTILMNINYQERSKGLDAHLYKKSELQKLLKYFYGYQSGSPSYEELIINLVEKIKANRLKNVDYCLALVAKRKGYEWAKLHIVQKHLYPLLNDYLKQPDPERALDDRICCLIFTVSAILKTQPNFQDVSGVMQMLGGILQMAERNQRVQEAAVAGLMRFTRFGYADIYEWLCKWCPSYEVTGRIKLMLATFVHRKEERFWEQMHQRKYV